MHPLTFGIKRMFLRTVSIHRGFTRHYNLTPARFDMLTAIAKGRHGIVQRSVRYMLATASPTISRMMRSLEKLGYITRCKYPPDRRHRWVTLTALGREVITEAEQDLTVGTDGELLAREMVSPEFTRREPTEKALAQARTMFRRIRRLLEDTALLRYPAYGPDDARLPEHALAYPDEWPSWMTPPVGRP